MSIIIATTIIVVIIIKVRAVITIVIITTIIKAIKIIKRYFIRYFRFNLQKQIGFIGGIIKYYRVGVW